MFRECSEKAGRSPLALHSSIQSSRRRGRGLFLAALAVNSSSVRRNPGQRSLQNLGQPFRNPPFDFEDRAGPEIKLLPIDVLIADFVQPLPRDTSGLIVGALTREVLQSIGRFAHALVFSFFHAAVSRGTGSSLSQASWE